MKTVSNISWIFSPAFFYFQRSFISTTNWILSFSKRDSSNWCGSKRWKRSPRRTPSRQCWGRWSTTATRRHHVVVVKFNATSNSRAGVVVGARKTGWKYPLATNRVTGYVAFLLYNNILLDSHPWVTKYIQAHIEIGFESAWKEVTIRKPLRILHKLLSIIRERPRGRFYSCCLPITSTVAILGNKISRKLLNRNELAWIQYAYPIFTTESVTED